MSISNTGSRSASKGVMARKRTTTGNSCGSDASSSSSSPLRDETSTSSLSVTPAPSPMPAYHLLRDDMIHRGNRSVRHNSHVGNDSNTNNLDDEEMIALLSPNLSSLPNQTPNEHGKASNGTLFLALLSCIRNFLRDAIAYPSPSSIRRLSKRQKCCYGFLTTIIVVFVVEKLVFAVRYVTMGRPAILYGSPMNWDVVKGCLSRTYKQDLIDYKITFNSGLSQLPIDLNPDVVWTWYRYGSIHHHDNTTNSIPRRRLLIAQYSGFGSYSKILKEVAPINKAYARKWGHDYLTLEGTAFRFPGFVYTNDGDDSQHTCRSMDDGYEAQSTFNKMALLFEAMKHTKLTTEHLQTATEETMNDSAQAMYDQVLILDTDTMIVDLDFDITLLLLSNDLQTQITDDAASETTWKKDYFLSAFRVWWNDWRWTWDINAGITLWNLHHPTTRQVAETWLKQSLTHPKDVLLKNDDQFFLQRALISIGWWRRMRDGVRTVRDELEYYDATLIKHFKRDARSWTRTSLEQRLLRIKEAKNIVCTKWPQNCEAMYDN